jgi:phosphoribosylaminoimidazole-succinocarboxamide synthase
MPATARPALYESSLRSLPLVGRGKVRDNYAVGEDKLLIVTTDRLSAFDVVMGEAIPDKGRVLNQMALFWFEKLADVVPNHLTGIAPESVVAADEVDQVRGRSMDYQATGAICGIELPPGLEQAAELPEPIFTPAAKAAAGEHDENISFDDMASRVGRLLAERVRAVSIELYLRAREYAAKRGIIIADTKFEFGLDDAGVLHLMDEALTADSSRFWPADAYRPGISPPSFDKQFVRDYLETVPGWNKKAPAPALPPEVVAATAEKYREALRRLTGRGLD